MRACNKLCGYWTLRTLSRSTTIIISRERGRRFSTTCNQVAPWQVEIFRQPGRINFMNSMAPIKPATASADVIKGARSLFDIPDGITYLNCANMAPQLRSVTESGICAVRAKATPWKLTAPEWFSGAEEL